MQSAARIQGATSCGKSARPGRLLDGPPLLFGEPVFPLGPCGRTVLLVGKSHAILHEQRQGVAGDPAEAEVLGVLTVQVNDRGQRGVANFTAEFGSHLLHGVAGRGVSQ